MAYSPSFLAIQKELNDKYGTVFRQIGQVDRRRLPTGVFNLDYCLGGGLPVNRVILICGHKACYKTILALKTIKSYQSLCNFCFESISNCSCGGQFSLDRDEEIIISGPLKTVYIDTEHALDPALPLRLGINPENFYIFDPPHGEAACQYAEKFARIPEVGIIVTDSLAALVPEDELEKGYFDKMAQSLRSRLIARMYRALITHLNKSGYPPRLAIAINHLLPNRGGYGDILPGGETQKYLSSVVLKLQIIRKQYISIDKKGEEVLEEEEDSDEPKRAVKLVDPDASKIRKQPIRFIVEHSKVSPDLMKGEFEIFLGEDRDIRFGDTDDFNAVYYRASKIGLTDGVKKSDLRQLWREDKLAYERIKRSIIQGI